MTRQCFTNGTILCAGQTAPECLYTDGDRISADQSSPAEVTIDLEGGYLLPGMIDVQVNGGGGVLFNDDPNVETIARMARAHLGFGTTGLLPTLISDDLDKVDRAMRAVEAAIEAGNPQVLGIHLEGPFLAPARKGTHDAAHFRRIDDDAIALLTSMRHGRTIVTLAPEQCRDEDIARLTAAGVVVSAGHTNATYEQMTGAFRAGITGVTHLFNAMSPFNHRAPGAVGATLEDREVYAGIIVDGAHVAPAALRVAMAARPHDRFMLVTDAMCTVGSRDKTFMLQGKPVRVENGVCVDENGVLTGSDLDMAAAFRNAATWLGLAPQHVATMATSAPAAFLGITDRGVLAPGRRADLLWMDPQFALRRIWLGGEGLEPFAQPLAPVGSAPQA